MAAQKGTGMIGAGSAALRRVMSASLKLRKDSEDDDQSANPDKQALAGDSINAIIEGEIIPRLLMAHAIGTGGAVPHSEIDPSAANKFALLPLRLEAANLLEEVDAFLADGVSVEAVFLDLLAPAARRLGEMWEDDEADFLDVTMGLWRLQEVMREISARAPIRPPLAPPEAARALFAPMPGDQHNFGALMMDEIFARAGWNSRVLTKPLRKELLDALSREPFDVVGLTLSRDCPSAAVTNIIKAMRSVSANPHLSILIGGRMINQNPALVAEVGADGTGADARAALDVAERLVQSAVVRAHMLK
ncbi:Coenzyme B12-binding protein [Erythrobacter sp. NAP1]|uniref:cobalamin B12-binding domain-containing protein n=1 Tax=Erythrobacter sp. NAP1 TaxID=237727 RepID=UPI0000685265|nr:cobalamin B12-binding domain-containing protein [Erythrobacter sp. NAP1]EAQ27794.1 Coenzyme B12-binding protein [Erythrobacter sp. NAP1]